VALLANCGPRAVLGPGDGDTATPPPPGGDPLSAPIPGCQPTPPPNTGDIYEDCVERINQFRAECQHLPPLTRWTDAEACANQQATYDSTHTPHAAFTGQICSPTGSGQNECPGWVSTAQVISQCLQSMWDEGPGQPFSAHGHYLNMSSTAFTRVACGFYTDPTGRVWAVQNFSP
jgi:hypothetical protein